MGATPAAAPHQLPNSSPIRSRHAFVCSLSSHTIQTTVARSTYDIIANNGSTLDDAARARFTNYIMPKKTFDVARNREDTQGAVWAQHVRFCPSLRPLSDTAQRRDYPRLHRTCQSTSQDGRIQ
ncbi:hypothetical protein Y032_0589g364 [Ancylostoma ceylanicum]|uniref:Uncharacterized protein n=1 Tax=Ancylostoma ceylanicum TaxID=53326 RepID=A0A016WPF6_9BILA|nr:hypothetical protein Y032_0589g364 [Ancylostoma ceylanicum]